MIQFQTIKWRNFLYTGNVFTTIPLNSDRTTLIVGRNGSGKSTILDALAFSLFGKAYRNINKGNLINSVNGRDCVVEIDFKTNSKAYKIIRGIKPNIFEIYCDGTLLNQDSSIRDYQEYLETNVLKMTFKSFTQIVILGSASFTPFMQLSPADRRLVIEDLLDIQIFTVMNSIVKTRLLTNKENINSNSIEIKNKLQNKDFIVKSIKSLEELDQETLGNLEERRQACIDQIEKMKTKIGSIEKKRNTFQAQLSSLKAKKAKQQKYLVLKTQLESVSTQTISTIDFLTNQDSCPTCKQEIHPQFKEEELKKHTHKKEELADGIFSITNQLKNIEADVTMLEKISEDMEELNREAIGCMTALSSFHSNLNGINEEIKKLGTSNKTLALSRADLFNILEELEKLEDNKKSLIEEKTLAETGMLLLKDGGIKTKIIKQYIPVINKMINKYLTQMDFFVNFNIDENFNETIKSRFRDDFSYHSFSEGEKFRIDLALLLTWRNIARMRNSVNCNLLLLDEIFDGSLDSNGIDEFLKIMNDIDKGTNVVVISHKTENMIDKFDKVHKFVKERNFSKLEG